MLKCDSCGAVFDDDNAAYTRECIGEFWGSPAYDSYPCCPECGSDEIDDFEYPYKKCIDYKDCDYQCSDCPLNDMVEEEE